MMGLAIPQMADGEMLGVYDRGVENQFITQSAVKLSRTTKLFSPSGYHFLAGITLVLAAWLTPISVSAAITAAGLRCESRIEPLGVDAAQIGRAHV